MVCLCLREHKVGSVVRCTGCWYAFDEKRRLTTSNLNKNIVAFSVLLLLPMSPCHRYFVASIGGLHVGVGQL